MYALAVPEPSTLYLTACGLVTLAAVVLRRMRYATLQPPTFGFHAVNKHRGNFMNRIGYTFVAILFLSFASTAPAQAQFTILHSFLVNEGRQIGGVTLSGSTLYGVASQSGPSGVVPGGSLFKLSMDGTGFAVLHAFGTDRSEGEQPVGSLVLSASTLYGVTNQYGGDGNSGTIFKINTDGSGFAVLHAFATTGGDGYGPFSGLTFAGNVLYGTTTSGGTNDAGTIYKINTDGTGYSVLPSFSSTSGGWERRSLGLFSGWTLYVAYRGGRATVALFSKCNERKRLHGECTRLPGD